MTTQKTGSTQAVSDQIRHRIQESGRRFHANDNISEFIQPGELEHLQREVEDKF